MARSVCVGDLIYAVKPFRIGIGRGPERNGLCAKGDEFYVLEVYGDDIRVLNLCEWHRRGYPSSSYLHVSERGEWWRVRFATKPRSFVAESER